MIKHVHDPDEHNMLLFLGTKSAERCAVHKMSPCANLCSESEKTESLNCRLKRGGDMCGAQVGGHANCNLKLPHAVD